MRTLLSSLTFSLLLAACGSVPTPAPTLAASATPVPTATQPAVAEVAFGPAINVNHQFVISEVNDYVYRVTSSRIEMVSLDGEILFIIGILPGTETDNSPLLVEALQGSLGAFDLAEPGSVPVGGQEGVYQPFTSSKSGVNFEGAYAILPLGDGREFFALGAGRNNEVNSWQLRGQSDFRALLRTVNFEIDPALVLQCQVSNEADYGLSPEQAIKVGGSVLGETSLNSTARVRAYFNTLRGPEGEMVGFERIGPSETVGTLLDMYRVETLSDEMTVYIDLYNYEPLFAPQGFICASDFPMAAPQP